MVRFTDPYLESLIWRTGTVRVFKNDTRLRKPFPLLIRFSDTGEAPENLNAAPEDLNAAPEDP